MNHLASNVRRLRKAKGLTQAQLIKLSGVTSVKRIESGGINSPHYGSLEAIASALGAEVSDLFVGDKRKATA